MKTTTQTARTTLAIAALLALAACGGGGGSGGGSSTGAAAPASGASTPSTTSSATSANVSTPQYAASSAQLAAFTLLNQERQQCGFPALVENTQLDTAATAHAKYMSLNGGLITDTELATNQGFTGGTYAERATTAGYPGASVYVGGVSGGYYTNATLTEAQYGQGLIYTWLSGVYHIAIGAWPVTAIGVGESEITFNGFPQVQGSLTIANLQPMTTSGPLTFPCQGTTGIAYEGGGETPTPPNTSGQFGTPVAVTGNPTDTIVLTSGTMTPTSGPAITLNVLDSANDPNKLLPAFEGVAYSTSPLSPNTTYAVSINGTYNGTAFSRNFTFTTGNVVG
jgi:hypothetical protein